MVTGERGSVEVSTIGIGHLVIVAGGKGTRLAGLTGDLPKALVPIGGKPVLQHQLELAARAGLATATVFAGHMAGQIVDFVGDGSRFGLRVEVQVENAPLGNGGGVLAALDRLPEHFMVVYGDVMLGVDLAAMARAHHQRRADFTAFVHPNDHPFDSDLIEVNQDGWVQAIHPYPHPSDRFFANLVNAGLYVVRREALRPLAKRGRPADFTKDILPELVNAGGGVLAYSSSEYIKDMGTPARLARVEKDLAAGRLDLDAATALAPAVFLDRDGTLNRDTGFLASPEGLELLAGVGPALRRLRQGGYRLVVVTNQPVVARGEASTTDVEDIHRRLEWELGRDGAFLDAIYYCPHHPDAGFPGERPELKGPCECRKPAHALVARAAREHRLDLARSWIVGDQTADLELARRAGLRSVLVRTGAAGIDGKYDATPDHTADDLAAAADLILAAV